MKIDRIIKSFIPRHKLFFIYFSEASATLLEAAECLSEMVKTCDSSERNSYAKKIKELEHFGDNISHKIYNELNNTFITPFDREDIYKLTSTLDDVLDMINGSAQRIIYFSIQQADVEVISLCDIVAMAAREIHSAILDLKNYKTSRTIHDNCIRINQLENNADDIFRASISKLMNEEKNVIELIKKKEILETIEEATDYTEDVANIILSILMKIS